MYRLQKCSALEASHDWPAVRDASLRKQISGIEQQTQQQLLFHRQCSSQHLLMRKDADALVAARSAPLAFAVEASTPAELAGLQVTCDNDCVNNCDANTILILGSYCFFL